MAPPGSLPAPPAGRRGRAGACMLGTLAGLTLCWAVGQRAEAFCAAAAAWRHPPGAAAAGGWAARTNADSENLEEALQREVARRFASGSSGARELDALSVAPERARPSPLLAPDRVLEHVLHSLASLPVEAAADQAFAFSDLVPEDVGHPAELRRSWQQEGAMRRADFATMLNSSYGPLLGRTWQRPLRHLADPAWSSDDREVSFLVAAGWRGSPVAVTMHRPGAGSHRDCWLVGSVALRALPRGAAAEVDEHVAYQEKTFDDLAHVFAGVGATPPAVVPRMHRIARTCSLTAGTSILDVATGTGALLPFLAAEGGNLSAVTGVDVSEGMLRYARERFPSATFVKSDIMKYAAAESRLFDRVIFNAVFGNFADQGAVLRHTANSLVAPGGVVVISHPLGRAWLETLRAKDPKMVPWALPSEESLRRLLQEHAPALSVVTAYDEQDYFCVVLRRT